MKRDVILKMAASSMVFATVLTGCGPFGGGSVASISSKPATAKDAAKYAEKAEKAMAKGDVDSAIAFAERSVAGAGSDPETRALLGQAYLSAGRMASAERSFQDAMDLGKTDARTILSLSLAQLGQGKADKAKALVVANRQYIPAADYGLALALTGDAKTAIEVLEQAIRESNVTARTRQNLGLAYALDGRWKEAKLMAVQDVAPAAINDRVMEWAQMARPGAYETRVATLLNVTPVPNDPGQPVQLALQPSYAPANAAASAENDYGQEVASFLAAENNVRIASVTVPASSASGKAPTNIPVTRVLYNPQSAAPAAKFAVQSDKPAPVMTPAVQTTSSPKPVLQKIAYQPAAKAASSVAGTHLVQLGAFSSAEAAKRAWGILSAKNSDLDGFEFASSKINVKGKTLYRMAAAGFGNQQAAEAMCAGIKAKGGNCIVRRATSVNKVAPSRMASQSVKKLASR